MYDKKRYVGEENDRGEAIIEGKERAPVLMPPMTSVCVLKAPGSALKTRSSRCSLIAALYLFRKRINKKRSKRAEVKGRKEGKKG